MSLLTRCLAGQENPPTTAWTAVPILSLIRQRYVASYLVQGGNIEALTWPAQQSECYNVCTGLNPVGETALTEAARQTATNSIVDAVNALGDLRSLTPRALEELRSIGVPDPHIRYIEPYLLSDNAVTRFFAVATLCMLATIFLIGLPLTVPA